VTLGVTVAHVEGTDVFDAAYAGSAEALYPEIRREAFGEDIGQVSWLTADDQRAFCDWLELGPVSRVLEVACGADGPALFTTEETGAFVTGVDIHEASIEAATVAANERGLGEKARFLVADGRVRLPFDERRFDAIICVYAINHF
jgi:SAM-dependent methyltransferase